VVGADEQRAEPADRVEIRWSGASNGDCLDLVHHNRRWSCGGAINPPPPSGAKSSVDGCLLRRAVANPGDLLRRASRVERHHLLARQRHVRRPEVLFQILAPLGAGDRHYVRALLQQPGERDLRWRGFLAFRDCLHQIDDGQVRFAIIRCEARYDVPEVGAVESRGLVDLSGKEAFPEWAEGHEPDAELAQSAG
jgi:hypothetical protein